MVREATCLTWSQRIRLKPLLCYSILDFSGGLGVKNLLANTGTFSPWCRKTPHTSKQFTPCTTTAEPAHPRNCSPTWEAIAISPAAQLESSPGSPQLEKTHAQQRRSSTAKNKSLNKLKFFYICIKIIVHCSHFPSGSDGKESICNVEETWIQSLGWEDPLEKGTATHCSIFVWRIPWTVLSMGSQRVRHNWATFNFTFIL